MNCLKHFLFCNQFLLSSTSMFHLFELQEKILDLTIKLLFTFISKVNNHVLLWIRWANIWVRFNLYGLHLNWLERTGGCSSNVTSQCSTLFCSSSRAGEVAQRLWRLLLMYTFSTAGFLSLLLQQIVQPMRIFHSFTLFLFNLLRQLLALFCWRAFVGTSTSIEVRLRENVEIPLEWWLKRQRITTTGVSSICQLESTVERQDVCVSIQSSTCFNSVVFIISSPTPLLIDLKCQTRLNQFHLLLYLFCALLREIYFSLIHLILCRDSVISWNTSWFWFWLWFTVSMTMEWLNCASLNFNIVNLRNEKRLFATVDHISIYEKWINLLIYSSHFRNYSKIRKALIRTTTWKNFKIIKQMLTIFCYISLNHWKTVHLSSHKIC